jgi:hypothetical protein
LDKNLNEFFDNSAFADSSESSVINFAIFFFIFDDFLTIISSSSSYLELLLKTVLLANSYALSSMS